MIDRKKLMQKLTEMGKERILILLLAGVLLLVIAIPGGKKNTGEEKTALTEERSEGGVSEDAYTEALERRLSEILSEMDGAGEVSVMITLESSAEKIVEKDTEENREAITEEDSQGGSRTTQNTDYREEAVYSGGSDSGQGPYVSKELSPKVAGVVVIAPGGDDAVVVKNITEAVQALFGIDTHKIRIVKGRREDK